MGATATLEVPALAKTEGPKLEILPPVKRPKGYENLVEIAKDFARDSVFAALTSVERGYELGRHITEFAERKEVAAEVGRINKERQDQKKGGRPLAGHCYVAGMLEEDTGLSKAWLEKCARAFLKDKDSGFAIGKQLSMLISAGKSKLTNLNAPLIAGALPNPERLLPGGAEEDEERVTPKEEITKIAKPLVRFFYDDSGNPRARKNAELRMLAEQLNTLFEPFGWMVAPKAKR
jgi:hypothetical protein